MIMRVSNRSAAATLVGVIFAAMLLCMGTGVHGATTTATNTGTSSVCFDESAVGDGDCDRDNNFAECGEQQSVMIKGEKRIHNNNSRWGTMMLHLPFVHDIDDPKSSKYSSTSRLVLVDRSQCNVWSGGIPGATPGFQATGVAVGSSASCFHATLEAPLSQLHGGGHDHK